MEYGDLGDLNDEGLVDAFQKTELEEVRQAIFVEIYRRYRKKVAAWIEVAYRRGMLDESSIEDVFNDVFLGRLYPEGERKGLLGFRQEGSLKAYIYMVTQRCILDEIRRKRPRSLGEITETQRRFVDLQHGLEVYRTWVPIASRPDDIAISKQRSKILWAALDSLAQSKRKDSWKDAYIIRMYYWSKMTDKEIGESLNMKEGTVTVRRYRALIKLRGILKQEFGIEDLDDIL